MRTNEYGEPFEWKRKTCSFEYWCSSYLEMFWLSHGKWYSFFCTASSNTNWDISHVSREILHTFPQFPLPSKCFKYRTQTKKCQLFGFHTWIYLHNFDTEFIFGEKNFIAKCFFNRMWIVLTKHFPRANIAVECISYLCINYSGNENNVICIILHLSEFSLQQT